MNLDLNPKSALASTNSRGAILYFTAGEVKANIIVGALKAKYAKFGVLATSSPHLMVLSDHGTQDTMNLVRWPVRRTPFDRFLHPIVFLSGALILAIIGIRKLRATYSVYVGEGPFTTLLGLVLKRLRLAKKVVFYIQDWYPPTYSGGSRLTPLLRRIVTKVEEIDLVDSDFIWANNQRLLEAHSFAIQLRHHPEKKFACRVVPVLFNVNQITLASKEKSRNVVYLGGISSHVAFEICFQALSMLKQKGDRILLDIAGREADFSLRQLAVMADKYGVFDQYTYHGYLRGEDLLRLLRRSSSGFMVYTGGKDNYYSYSLPGKVRDYLSHGVPVVISKNNVAAEEIEHAGAGIAVDPLASEVAEAIQRLVNDAQTEQTYSKNCIMLSRQLSNPILLYAAIDEAAA